jgi:general stress protein 26
VSAAATILTVNEIDLSDNICLVFSDIRKQHSVSLTGRAELSDDRAKIKQLWSSLDSAFWSDENDPSIRVLKITPIIAEYWDRAGTIARRLIPLTQGGLWVVGPGERLLCGARGG